MVVYGAGLALVVAPVTATVLAAADDRHAGVASGINNAVARVAGLIAVAVLPLIAGLSGEAFYDPEAMDDGFKIAMVVTACLSLAGGLIAFLMIDSEVLEREDPEHDCDRAATDRNCGVAGTPLRPGRHVGDEAGGRAGGRLRAESLRAPAAAGAAGVLGDALQIHVELAALLGRERREELALGFGDRGLRAAKALGPRRRELDELAPAVARVAAADDQAVHLELIEEGDEVRGVKAKDAAELAAVGGPALLEPVEDRELMPGHPQGIQRAPEALARHAGDAGEQDPAAGFRCGACARGRFRGAHDI